MQLIGLNKGSDRLTVCLNTCAASIYPRNFEVGDFARNENILHKQNTEHITFSFDSALAAATYRK